MLLEEFANYRFLVEGAADEMARIDGGIDWSIDYMKHFDAKSFPQRLNTNSISRRNF